MKDYMVLNYEQYQKLVHDGLLFVDKGMIERVYELLDDVVAYREYHYCYHNPGYKYFDKFTIDSLRVRVKVGRSV